MKRNPGLVIEDYRRGEPGRRTFMKSCQAGRLRTPPW
jgi:hypothetical protein